MRQSNKTKKKKLNADSAERCGILVWTQFSAVCLLSLAEGVRLFPVSDRLAQDGLVGSFGRPHLLQTSAQAGPHQCAFTGRFHVSFNEETASLAARYKQQAN